jgi:hypothetical protein
MRSWRKELVVLLLDETMMVSAETARWLVSL